MNPSKKSETTPAANAAIGDYGSPKNTKKLLREFQTERTRIISDMLENEGENGIFPTTWAYKELDKIFLKLLYERQKKGN